MKYLSLLFCIFLVACGGHEKAGSGETTRTISANNWPKDLSVKEDELFSYDPQVQSNLEGSISYSSENLPAWAQLDTKTGVITGTPTNDDSGRKYSRIKLLVNNGNSKALEIGPFSIDVVAVNDAPEISAQSIQANKTDVAYEGELAYVDIDNTVNQLTFEIIKQPEHADVEMVLGTSRFRVVPKSFEVFNSQQSFDVKVKDGSEETDSVTIDFSLMDESEFSFHINIPADSNLVAPDKILLNSSHSIDLSEITFISTSGACSGSIMISDDGFNSCVPLQLEVLDAFNTQFQLDVNLSSAKTYEIRTKDQIKNVFSKLQENVFKSNFKTIDHLLITEVSGGDYPNTVKWIELYNPSGSAINLSSYALKSKVAKRVGVNTWDYPLPKLYPLPNMIVESGAYLLIKSQDFYSLFPDTANTVYLGDNLENPYWWKNGIIELVENDGASPKTVDYFAYGNQVLSEEFKPYTSAAWVGPLFPEQNFPQKNAETYSISRLETLIDTNTESDWKLSNIATPGYANDVVCTTDTDADGFFDCNEEEGTTFSGVDLYSLGARKNQKDIFIEVDYMASNDNNVRPRKKALEKVKEVFKEKGIHVHFDASSLFPNTEFDLGGGNQVPLKDCVTLHPPKSECEDFYTIKNQNMDTKRLYSFHYMLFAYKEDVEGVIGRAEINGNDILITMGEWKNQDGSEFTENQIINLQASTIMHELGHNLGLRHGGDSDLNNKPNYLSVMNYLYTNKGLPTVGEREGQRYYESKFFDPENCFGMDGSPITNPNTGSPDDFVIDFSNGESVSILERVVNESMGLGRVDSEAVDFNCNGVIDSNTYGYIDMVNPLNAQGDDIRQFDHLTDYDDWSSINLKFQSFSSSNAFRYGQDGGNDQPIVFIGDDRSPIAIEYPVK